MLNADKVIALFVGFIGFLLFWGSTTLPAGYMPGVPGPGFFPRLISLGLIILAILLFFHGIKTNKKYFTKEFFTNPNFKSFLWIISATAIYVLAWIFEIGTFIINSITYFAVILYFFGEKRVVYIIGLSVGFSLFTFFFFTRVLRIWLQ